jgi:hypothetical protein
MHSRIGNKGRVYYVACSECEQGGNGSAAEKCSCGWKVKRWNKMGCVIGTLIAKYHEEARGSAGNRRTTAPPGQSELIGAPQNKKARVVRAKTEDKKCGISTL